MTYAHSEYLISPQELMQQLNDPSLRFTTHQCYCLLQSRAIPLSLGVIVI